MTKRSRSARMSRPHAGLSAHWMRRDAWRSAAATATESRGRRGGGSSGGGWRAAPGEAKWRWVGWGGVVRCGGWQYACVRACACVCRCSPCGSGDGQRSEGLCGRSVCGPTLICSLAMSVGLLSAPLLAPSRTAAAAAAARHCPRTQEVQQRSAIDWSDDSADTRQTQPTHSSSSSSSSSSSTGTRRPSWSPSQRRLRLRLCPPLPSPWIRIRTSRSRPSLRRWNPWAKEER